MTQVHYTVGTTILALSLVVGVWALIAVRSGQPAGRALTVALGVVGGVLGLQLLLGMDLWTRGFRPAANPQLALLNLVHMLGPVIALGLVAFALTMEPRHRPGRYALAALVTFALALVSFSIGEMGNRP